MCQSLMPKKIKLNFLWGPTRPSRTSTKKKGVLFIIGDWSVKVGNQEIPGVPGNLALEYRMKQGKG